MSKYVISVNSNEFIVENTHLGSKYVVKKQLEESPVAFLERVWNTYPKRVFYLVKDRFNRNIKND